MNENLKFRKASKADTGALGIVLAESFKAASDQSYIDLFQKYVKEHPDKVFFIAEVGGEIAGMVAVHSWEVIPKPGKLGKRLYWQIANFYVKPAFRDKNLGRDFLEYLLSKAKEANVEKVIVFAGGEFGEFFIKNGFLKENTLLLFKNS